MKDLNSTIGIAVDSDGYDSGQSEIDRLDMPTNTSGVVYFECETPYFLEDFTNPNLGRRFRG